MDFVALARRYVDLSNRHDVAGCLAMLHDDATYASSQVGEYRGKAAIEGMMRPFFASHGDVFWEVAEYKTLREDGVEFDFVMRGTNTSTGDLVERRGTERVFFTPEGQVRHIEVVVATTS